MTLQSSSRSGGRHQTATRMWGLLLPAVILLSCIGSISGGMYLVHDEEGNYSIYFNGSHVLYYQDYYDENSTYEVDYSPYETPAPKYFNNSASHSLQGPLPFFFSLLHLLHFLLQDIRM